MTTTLIGPRTGISWLVIVVITAVSAWVGIDYGAGGADIAAVAVLALAMVKVWLVGMHFMELRDAPILLRGIFAAWCAVLFVTVTALFLVS